MTTSARTDIRNLTALATAAALAIFLGYLKLYRMPQGGSITLEAIPILFVALWRGPRTGILAGLFTGVLKLLLDPFIVHPIQVLLDYPVPFLCLGLVAYLPQFPRLGILLASTARWGSHALSGVIFFGSYAPEGVSVWKYSALYNLSYIGPETLISILLVPQILRRFPSQE